MLMSDVFYLKCRYLPGNCIDTASIAFASTPKSVIDATTHVCFVCYRTIMSSVVGGGALCPCRLRGELGGADWEVLRGALRL